MPTPTSSATLTRLPSPEDSPLPEPTTPDQFPPELAPFVAHAQARLEQATEGLNADETIAHLEATVASAEAEASRLGLRFPPPDLTTDTPTLGDGNSIVVIQRVDDSDQSG